MGKYFSNRKRLEQGNENVLRTINQRLWKKLESNDSIHDVIELLGEPDKQKVDSTQISITYFGAYKTSISFRFDPVKKTIKSAMVFTGKNSKKSDLDLRIYALDKLDFLNDCEIVFLGKQLQDISTILGNDYRLIDKSQHTIISKKSLGYISDDANIVVLFSLDPQQNNRCHAMTVVWQTKHSNQEKNNEEL